MIALPCILFSAAAAFIVLLHLLSEMFSYVALGNVTIKLFSLSFMSMLFFICVHAKESAFESL